MNQLMSQEMPPRFALRPVFPIAKDDVVAECVGFCADCAGGLGCCSVNMNSDSGEVVPKTWLEEIPGFTVE